jgi:hypothetical protein
MIGFGASSRGRSAPSNLSLVPTFGPKLCNPHEKPRDPARPGSLVTSKQTAVRPHVPVDLASLAAGPPLQVAARTVAGTADEKPFPTLTGGHP